MSVAIRRLHLSGSADDLLVKLAAAEELEPEIFGSLILELAIRERHQLDEKFRLAAAKVLLDGK